MVLRHSMNEMVRGLKHLPHAHSHPSLPCETFTFNCPEALPWNVISRITCTRHRLVRHNRGVALVKSIQGFIKMNNVLSFAEILWRFHLWRKLKEWMIQTKETELYWVETGIAFVCRATVMEIGVSIRWVIYWEMMAECLAEKYFSSDKSLSVLNPLKQLHPLLDCVTQITANFFWQSIFFILLKKKSLDSKLQNKMNCKENRTTDQYKRN